MLFIKLIERGGSASSRYNYCIKNWVTTFCDHVENFIGPNHMNSYPNRKVGATYDYLGTTSPPTYIQYYIVVNGHLV